MAARKQKQGRVVMVPAAKSEEHAKRIVHRISTAVIKTATPSRAQGKIQVRVAWTEPDGKPGLGYLSMDPRDAEGLSKGGSGPSLHNFFQDVFRTVQWAKETCRKETGSDRNDWGAFEEDLMSELRKLGVFNSDSKIHELRKQAVDAIRQCAAAGKHKSARHERLKGRAKESIGRVIGFAISQGLKDSEIRELIELAFVKHTMES